MTGQLTAQAAAAERPSPKPRSSRRWRAGYSVAMVVAVTGLVTGLGSATLSTNGSGTGSASTGTVALSTNGSASKTCSYNTLLPGDLTGAATCTFSVGYTGSLPAYLSLTVQIQSKPGSGGRSLYGGGSAGLTLSISDGQHSYTVPAGTGATGGSCPAGFTCWTAQNDLAAWYGGGPPNLIFAAGDSVTFTLTPQFPRSVGNGYQGGAAAVTLTAQAVQATANPLPAACTVATIGQPCPAAGTFTWS